jgi:hypothetical protein
VPDVKKVETAVCENDFLAAATLNRDARNETISV